MQICKIRGFTKWNWISFLWKFKFTILHSWYESTFIFVTIHENIFMNVHAENWALRSFTITGTKAVSQGLGYIKDSPSFVAIQLFNRANHCRKQVFFVIIMQGFSTLSRNVNAFPLGLQTCTNTQKSKEKSLNWAYYHCNIHQRTYLS